MSKNIIPSKYIVRLDEIDQQIISSRLKHEDIKTIVTKDIAFLNCTRTINDKPIIQTIDYTYKNIITKLICMINRVELDESERESYINKIKECHNKNIEYEKEHIPIIYDKGKTKTNKQTNKEKKTKEHKEKKEDNNKALRAALLKTLKFGVKL